MRKKTKTGYAQKKRCQLRNLVVKSVLGVYGEESIVGMFLEKVGFEPRVEQ